MLLKRTPLGVFKIKGLHQAYGDDSYLHMSQKHDETSCAAVRCIIDIFSSP